MLSTPNHNHYAHLVQGHVEVEEVKDGGRSGGSAEQQESCDKQPGRHKPERLKPVSRGTPVQSSQQLECRALQARHWPHSSNSRPVAGGGGVGLNTRAFRRCHACSTTPLTDVQMSCHGTQHLGCSTAKGQGGASSAVATPSKYVQLHRMEEALSGGWALNSLSPSSSSRRRAACDRRNAICQGSNRFGLALTRFPHRSDTHEQRCHRHH